MIQRGNRASLAFESLAPERIRCEMWRQHFDGDGPAKTRIEGPVDFAHPARADAHNNLIRTDCSPFEETDSGQRIAGSRGLIEEGVRAFVERKQTLDSLPQRLVSATGVVEIAGAPVPC